MAVIWPSRRPGMQVPPDRLVVPQLSDDGRLDKIASQVAVGYTLTTVFSIRKAPRETMHCRVRHALAPLRSRGEFVSAEFSDGTHYRTAIRRNRGYTGIWGTYAAPAFAGRA